MIGSTTVTNQTEYDVNTESVETRSSSSAGKPRLYPDGTVDARNVFYCRQCDGYPRVDGTPPLSHAHYRAALPVELHTNGQPVSGLTPTDAGNQLLRDAGITQA